MDNENHFNDNSEDFVFLWHRPEKLKSYQNCILSRSLRMLATITDLWHFSDSFSALLAPFTLLNIRFRAEFFFPSLNPATTQRHLEFGNCTIVKNSTGTFQVSVENWHVRSNWPCPIPKVFWLLRVPLYERFKTILNGEASPRSISKSLPCFKPSRCFERLF